MDLAGECKRAPVLIIEQFQSLKVDPLKNLQSQIVGQGYKDNNINSKALAENSIIPILNSPFEISSIPTSHKKLAAALKKCQTANWNQQSEIKRELPADHNEEVVVKIVRGTKRTLKTIVNFQNEYIKINKSPWRKRNLNWRAEVYTGKHCD